MLSKKKMAVAAVLMLCASSAAYAGGSRHVELSIGIVCQSETGRFPHLASDRSGSCDRHAAKRQRHGWSRLSR